MSFWDKLMGRGKKDANEDANQELAASAEEGAPAEGEAASEHERDATISGSGYPASPPKENK